MFNFILKGLKQLGMGSKYENISPMEKREDFGLEYFYLFFQIYHLLFQLTHSSFLSISGSLSCYSVFQFPENRRDIPH